MPFTPPPETGVSTAGISGDIRKSRFSPSCWTASCRPAVSLRHPRKHLQVGGASPWARPWCVGPRDHGPPHGPSPSGPSSRSDSVISLRPWSSCLAVCAPPPPLGFSKNTALFITRHARHIVHRKCSAAENRRRFFVLLSKQNRLFGFSNRSVQVTLNRRRFLGSDSHGASLLGAAGFSSSTVGQQRMFLGHFLDSGRFSAVLCSGQPLAAGCFI